MLIIIIRFEIFSNHNKIAKLTKLEENIRNFLNLYSIIKYMHS